jgi:Flp pilus assembly protein TadG
MINSFVSWTKRRSHALASFLSHTVAADRRGTVGIVFAATIIPVTASIGMAVDLGHAVRIKGDLQSTLDAVALATGRTLQTSSDEAAAETDARQYFARTVPDGFEAEITRLAIA